jgi:hypothetical protein
MLLDCAMKESVWKIVMKPKLGQWTSHIKMIKCVTFPIERVPDHDSEGVMWHPPNTHFDSFNIILWISHNSVLLSIRWLSEVHYRTYSLYIATKKWKYMNISHRYSIIKFQLLLKIMKKLIFHNICSLYYSKFLIKHRYKLVIECYKVLKRYNQKCCCQSHLVHWPRWSIDPWMTVASATELTFFGRLFFRTPVNSAPRVNRGWLSQVATVGAHLSCSPIAFYCFMRRSFCLGLGVSFKSSFALLASPHAYLGDSWDLPPIPD